MGDEERGIGALLERTKHIVLKLGGGGGSRLALRTPAGVRMFAAPAVQVSAVDTTGGAGDVFNGGFIAAYLQGGDAFGVAGAGKCACRAGHRPQRRHFFIL